MLAFHLFPKYINKGFIGVDIFFVLSGYLMTKILLKHQLSCSSIIDFYTRRVCRILPAYLSTNLLTLIIGYMLLIRDDLMALSRDQLWSLSFVSNFQPFFAVFIKKLTKF